LSFALTKAETITAGIDRMVEEICPEAGRRPMYGGIVFEAQPGVPKTMVCGHFIYKNHVSIEFTHGNKLRDPDGVLEGKGKFRRHIKLTCEDDLRDKGVRSMIARAFSAGT
jgi:hypothetical protein